MVVNRGVFARADAAEIAWVAALFEGEGTLAANKYSTKRYGDRYRLEVSIAMTDRDVLERLAMYVGCGSVWEKTRTALMDEQGRKTMHQWKLSGKPAEEMMWKIAPWLGQRRLNRFIEMLGRCRNE